MNPAPLQRKIQEGIALQQKGRLPDAAAIFAQIRTAAPQNFDGWHLGGTVALLQGNPAAAAELYSRAVRLNPRSAVAATCLGVARMAMGDFAGAEPHLRTAVKLEPKNAEIWNQLATLLSTAGRSDEAVKCHRQAVALNPRSAQAWHGYAATLSNLNLSSEALDCEKRSLAVDPQYEPARRGYATALQKCHRIPEAVQEYEVQLARNPKQFDIQSHRLFALNYLAGQTPASLFAAHRAFGELFDDHAAKWEPTAVDPNRKLRVAFFSADFREHSVAYFMEPLLRLLDRSRFEIFLYNFCNKPDAMTEHFRTLASVWRDFPSNLENVVEPVVRADAPEIAVDLGGHTGHSLMPLFARRIAPVQISYLGYPNTTGLRTMDFRFVDETSDPVGDADEFATEKLVRFSSCAWVYSPPAGAPVPTPPPHLKNGHITFGSFNNFSKVTDEMLALWARLLSEFPSSRLLLKSIGLSEPAIAAHAKERILKAGLPADRVEFSGAKATTAEHLAAYSLIDIALDTTPYNGTTTTCEALWMGVPVVTLSGDRHAARVSASLLKSIGHPGWIAKSPDEYLEIIRTLAGDLKRLENFRENSRDEMTRSPLMNFTDQAARFSDALRKCWENKRPPAAG